MEVEIYNFMEAPLSENLSQISRPGTSYYKKVND